MAKLNDNQIEDKCKDIENKIKQKNNVYRGDIQDIINRIIYNVESLGELDRQMRKLIVDRAGIKEFGTGTFYEPRVSETDYRRSDTRKEDITTKFLRSGELLTYLKVKERFNIA